jgi:uncharacterized protein (DUF1499 family)
MVLCLFLIEEGGRKLKVIRGFLLILACLAILPQCSGSRPANLGVTNGILSPCPSSPNCVSSQSPDKEHYVAPLRYEGTLTEARETLFSVIKSMDRARIVTDKGSYIHAEFTSALFRFVDDVEFYFDDANKTIHLRSASRVGYSDFGANRKRIENIRTRFMNLVISESNS